MNYLETITGTDGDDVLIGPEGFLPPFDADTKILIDGGAGNDTISLSFVTTNTIDSGRFANAGVDFWFLEDRVQGTVRTGGTRSVEIDADVLSIENATGTQLDDRFLGDDGSNILDGQAGKDLIWGFGGDDLLRDGAGADVMRGGVGRDVFAMDADGKHDAIQDINLTQDRIDVSAWGVEAFDKLMFSEEIRSGRDGGEIYRTRISYEDELLLVRDGLWTVRAADFTQDTFLFAGPDLPVLKATDGADKQFGTAFAERIEDGAGRDNLWGFAGADIFAMAADGDVDNIKDFQIGEDRIDLSAWGATGLEDLDLRLGNNDKVQVRIGTEKLTVKVLDDQPVTADTLGSEDFIFA